jgi:hypothetical protein
VRKQTTLVSLLAAAACALHASDCAELAPSLPALLYSRHDLSAGSAAWSPVRYRTKGRVPGTAP